MNETLASRILATLSVFVLGTVIVLGLWATGPDVLMGEQVRLLYIHPGVSWTAYVAFSVTTVASLLWLWPKTRKLFWDQIAGASAEIGVVFTVLSLLTGAIWGRPTWGHWWEWDARITSTTLLLFMYIGVLAIRSVPASLASRARRSAIVALIAFLDVPVVHFSVKWWRTLHQQASVMTPDKKGVQGWQLVALLLGLLGFTLVYFWMLIQRYRIARWEDRLRDGGLQAAIAARRAEGRSTGSSASGLGGSGVTASGLTTSGVSASGVGSPLTTSQGSL
jgi:heme exporter protein C